MVRLLFKRGATLLLSWVRLKTAPDPLPLDVARAVQREVSKTILACGDGWLFQHGVYDHRLLHRLEQFRRLPFARLGPVVALGEQYKAAAQSTLRPGGPVSQSRADHLERWRAAARLWLEYRLGFARWQQENTGLAVPGGRDPLYLLQRTVALARRLALRRPTSRQLQRVLPMLIQLAIDERAVELADSTAALLPGARTQSDRPLALASRFLLTWHPIPAVRMVAQMGLRADSEHDVKLSMDRGARPSIEPAAFTADPSHHGFASAIDGSRLPRTAA